MNKHAHNPKRRKRAPLWIWILIILLVVSMPLFFSFARSMQLQQALMFTKPAPQNTQAVQN